MGAFRLAGPTKALLYAVEGVACGLTLYAWIMAYVISTAVLMMCAMLWSAVALITVVCGWMYTNDAWMEFLRLTGFGLAVVIAFGLLLLSRRYVERWWQRWVP